MAAAVAAEETGSSNGGGGTAGATMIDETYEFLAPRFFDFINGETEEDARRAELWFDTALSYAPSRKFRSFLVEQRIDN